MALADAVAGARRPHQQITWVRADGEPENLGAATLTGKIKDRRTGEVRNITGALTVTDAAAGVFTWEYAAEDVAEPGEFEVQFSAAFGSGPTPAMTFVDSWRVRRSLWGE